jgi:hypothetical protein
MPFIKCCSASQLNKKFSTLFSIGDSLDDHNGMKFSTIDMDNDEGGGDCAEYNQGAWW